MLYGLILAVIVCIVMSLRTLFFSSKLKYKQVSFDNFLFLGFTYTVIMVGFGLLFMLLEIMGYQVIMEHGAILTGSYFERLGTVMYVSAITLFSVGYGDVVPVGLGRTLVMIEALLGYTIPAAFVVKSVMDLEQGNQVKK